MADEQHLIDTSGIPPAKLLAALVNNTQPVDLGCADPNAEKIMSLDDAEPLIMEKFNHQTSPRFSMYFDYLWGRAIKIDLAKTDPVQYERHKPKDAKTVQEIVDILRKNPEFDVAKFAQSGGQSAAEAGHASAAEASGMSPGAGGR
jgi:hypothetical protein